MPRTTGLLAAAVDKAWSEARGATALVRQHTNIANGAGFYLRGQPLRIDIAGPQ